ncbi:MAG: hypothetical protein ACTSUF_11305, partial [Candidatus Heimdallarchaeaceae archaeon]
IFGILFGLAFSIGIGYVIITAKLPENGAPRFILVLIALPFIGGGLLFVFVGLKALLSKSSSGVIDEGVVTVGVPAYTANKYCTNCGAQLPFGSTNCPNCGAPVGEKRN